MGEVTMCILYGTASPRRQSGRRRVGSRTQRPQDVAPVDDGRHDLRTRRVGAGACDPRISSSTRVCAQLGHKSDGETVRWT
jgi:hypothetical protein